MKIHVLAAIVAFLLACGSRLSADTLVAYPTADDPAFTIVVPDDWELTPAQSDGGFFLVTSPTNTELWFNAVEIGSEDDLDATIDASIEDGEKWLGEHYKDLEFGDTTEGERDGMPFVSMPGQGVEKKTDTAVTFTIAFIFTKSGDLVEFWSIVPVGDEKGKAGAQAVVDSFESK